MRHPVFSVRTAKLSLRARSRRAAFALALALPSILIAGESMRVGAAAVLANSFALSRLKLAEKVTPQNPEIHRKLGLYYLDSMRGLNPRRAAAQFRTAADLGPLDANYWSELAEACSISGDEACAGQALKRALDLNPMAPRSYWNLALHLVLTGRAAGASPYFKRLLAMDPNYGLAVLRLCARSLDAPQFILQTVYPSANNPTLNMDYVNFLVSHGKDDLAYTVWKLGLPSTSHVPFPSAAFFLDSLLQTGRVQKAESVWQDLETSRSISATPEPGNLVFNGGFERIPLGAGFDWRVQSSPYLFINFQSSGAYRDGHCLRVDFTVGQNDELEPAYQLVPVLPHHDYLLTAYVQSDSITSDSGPRLRVIDPSCPACLDVATEPVLATSPWHPVSLMFSTGASTRLIRLSVWRPRSRSFPFEITGTFWLDAVSLRPIAGLQQREN